MTKYRIKPVLKGGVWHPGCQWRIFVCRDTGTGMSNVNSFGMDSWEACRQTVWNSLSARFRG